MKRKTISIPIALLATVLMASSMVAVSQAWGPNPKLEYVSYDLQQVPGPGETTYVDASNAPELIIMEATETAIEVVITIDDEVYTYPDDFDYEGKTHIEFNAITGEGLARVEKLFIFNLPGKPVLKSWLVLRITGLIMNPATGQIDPENVHSEGEFRLAGTRRFATVEGFGLVEDIHHFGFIKGWPL